MGVHLLKKQHSSAPSSLGRGSGSGSASGSSVSASSMPPKGCMAVRVVGPSSAAAGRKEQEQEEEEERFVVPVGYLKHPLFVALLQAAEEEYGFEQKGAITIPCGVDHFRRVQGIIHHHGSGGGHHHGHHSSSSNHFHIAGCFRA
jgi:SAUR family protein